MRRIRSFPDGIELHRAEARDLELIARLAVTIWHRHYPGIISPAQIDYMLDRMYDPGRLKEELRSGVHYDVLTDHDQPAAFSGYETREQDLRLHKLYVHPEFQRRGHGGRLLLEVEAQARHAGRPELSLTVNKANHHAIDAYRKYGFTIRESIVTDIGGGFVMDDYVMAKAVEL